MNKLVALALAAVLCAPHVYGTDSGKAPDPAPAKHPDGRKRLERQKRQDQTFLGLDGVPRGTDHPTPALNTGCGQPEQKIEETTDTTEAALHRLNEMTLTYARALRDCKFVERKVAIFGLCTTATCLACLTGGVVSARLKRATSALLLGGGFGLLVKPSYTLITDTILLRKLRNKIQKVLTLLKRMGGTS